MTRSPRQDAIFRTSSYQIIAESEKIIVTELLVNLHKSSPRRYNSRTFCVVTLSAALSIDDVLTASRALNKTIPLLANAGELPITCSF